MAIAHNMAAGVVNEARQALPAQPLRGLIAAYHGYRQKGLPPAIHRGLPSPFLTLIFTLDEPLHLVAHPDAQRPPTLYESLLGGLHHTPATIAHAGAQGGIQLCLSPLGARALLGVPAGELASQDFAAGEVLGSLADEISERIAAEPTWEGRFAALDALLVPRLASRPAPPRPVAEAWRLLLGSGGRMSIGRVAHEVGWSEHQLGKRFAAEIGLSPKTAARVVRFHRARHALQSQLREDGQVSIAWVAAAAGYFDQSHLVRDFRQFAGAPPSQWLQEEIRNVQARVDPLDLASGT